jgi:DNA invertase Pin-like site-specific DNA recombinase
MVANQKRLLYTVIRNSEQQPITLEEIEARWAEHVAQDSDRGYKKKSRHALHRLLERLKKDKLIFSVSAGIYMLVTEFEYD